ncbi:hypothetical protein ASY01nite_17660 [Acetobacter syzygii]|nr:hypothetical protein ASY01nite_17660 [Acetobacter syzygii]
MENQCSLCGRAKLSAENSQFHYPVHKIDMVGVTGSIPVAPTIPEPQYSAVYAMSPLKNKLRQNGIE